MKIEKVVPFLAMLLVFLMAGCKKDDVSGTRPTVTGTSPINLATSVAVNSKLTATFSTAMDPSTITAANFTLLQGTAPVSGTVTYTGTTATFTPAANLAPNTLYIATVTNAVKDLAGKTMVNNFTWSFTTIADTSLPTVTSTDPANNATSVILTKLIAATFSEPMDPATITALTFTVKQGTTAVAGAVTYTGTTATFTPAAALTPNKVYTVTITVGAKDLAGNALASAFTYSFTTGNAPDTTLPMVNSTNPLNNATGVAQNKVVALVFSEAMDPLTINATTFTLKQGTTAVAGTVAYSGTTGTFTPSATLTVGTVYTAAISTGAKDLAGNALAASTVWSFTTELSPVVSSTDPLNNAISIARNKVVAINFSKAMNPTTINSSTFTLVQGTTPVSGTVAYSGTTATFTPTNLLIASVVYTATITTGAKDLAGNALTSNTVWSFTTGGTTSSLAVVDLGAAGNYLILAKTAITNISTSALTGDLGLSPAATSYITGLALTNATGYATSAQVTGQIFAADMASPTPINLTTAVNNMITAYNDAAGRPSPDFLELATGNIGGRTLAPGLYKWTTTVTMPADVVISGGPNDVWIFQISGDLTMSSAVRITLSGGAQAKNIFWQVAGQATFGTTTHFEGIVLSMTGITFQTGASMTGRALAQTAVVLDGNALTKPN